MLLELSTLDILLGTIPHLLRKSPGRRQCLCFPRSAREGLDGIPVKQFKNVTLQEIVLQFKM